ncbi:MAG TPA: hypothetical protein HPP41_00070 [Deltaproteobacteria bacterium]|nr:hypothetical protein [Deltaproteobacteria bacterium]
MGDEEYEEVADELREFHELQNTKIFLETENNRLRNQIEILTGELKGINIAMSSAEAYLVSYENRRKNCAENIEKLKSKRDVLMAEISNLHLKIKAAREDEESSSNLRERLKDELHDIKGEKALVLKRLNDIKTGLQQISSDRDVKLPYLKWYDEILKQAYNVFMETQNRMEVSLILRKR